MSNSITIFISGMTGVFVGMWLLWLFIKLTAVITDKLEKATASDRPEQGKEEKK